MKTLIAAILLCLPLIASASEAYESIHNGAPMILTKYDTPCISTKVLSFIKPEYHAVFKRATLMWEGKLYDSCWFEQNEVVFSIDEDGSPLQGIPLFRFTRNAGEI